MELGMNSLPYAALALVAAMIVLFVACMVYYVKALRILRERHESAWRELGSPTLIANNSIANNVRFYKYFVRKRHRSLQDDELNRVAVRLGWLGVAYLVVTFATVASLWIAFARDLN